MMRIGRRGLLGAGLATGALASLPAWSKTPAEMLGETEIDALVTRFLREFEVPGAAVAIVRPGQPDFARGYGVRRAGDPAKVDIHTLFAIGSNSKAFTVASIAMLVDEGKVGWDEPVIRYLPEFKMSDPAVTRMMTVRDLLVHRSGLDLGAGDLMAIIPSNHSPAEILHGLQYLKLNRGFRVGFAYSNVLYIIAGMLISRVSGQSWEDFVTSRIFAPLGMRDTVASRSRIHTVDVAGRHARLGPPVRGLGPLRTIEADEQDKIDPAGGINSSVHDIPAWLHLQLARGKLPDGKRLWSEEQTTLMWTPQTIFNTTAGPSADEPTRSVMTAYAMGWLNSDYRGHRLVFHAGGLLGQITQHALLPDLGCAVAVYTNVEDVGPSTGLRNALLDRLVGAPPFDWVAAMKARETSIQTAVLKATGRGDTPRPAGEPSLPLAAYAGRYRDPWYGDIVVTNGAKGLSIDFTRTPLFKSALEPWGQDAFRTHFPQGVGDDAVVQFAVENGAVKAVTMKAVSPIADFSFDFKDLAFVPVR